MNKKQILEKAKKEKIQFINLQFVDLLGFLKSVTIPISKLEDAIDSNVWFDGSSIEGFTRIYESDMYLKLDLNTFAVVPWEKTEKYNVARIICDVYKPNGEPFEGDPRNILKRQIAAAEKMGYTYYVGPELEFFIFKKDEQGNLQVDPHDNAGYFDYSSDKGVGIMQSMSQVVSEMGIDVETVHHEVARGQHEIDFKYSDALSQADAVMTVKTALRAVAEKNDLHVTFMPKPVFGENGTGMHIHQSLFKNGKNAFFDPKDKYLISKTAKHFIAGQLKYIEDIALITNPIVNSYKRLVPGYEAPVYITWGQTNRSALIRIPRVSKGNADSVRCELRCPDSASNPYLAFAAMLHIGLKGIKEQIETVEPIEENIYLFTDKKAKRMRIRTLPENLGRSIFKFERSQVAKDIFGKDTWKKYLDNRQTEWDEYRLDVSQWEIDRFMPIY
ncbi:MAG: type I glutamate--ammonia ligase [Candidatus Moranbacteria bacterium]|nr:type I glutamate--ammonia ligase [Candidatus Moranbacteria bacterium]